MKLSLNMAQYYSNVDLKSVGITEIVRGIGFQLGAIEEVIEYGKIYDGIVVAKVVSCEKHPNADKLSVCKIDDGGRTQSVERDENDNVRVVCGASNVRAGVTVAWIPPGVAVPSTVNKDPFILTPKDIRGVVSNGMLASLAELAISDNHDGILEIDENEVGEELSTPGTEFKKLYNIDDIVVDLENKMFTHRPDCFGVLGVARELAGIQGQAFKSPDWYSNLLSLAEGGEQSNELPLDVKVEDQNLVPRFMAVAMRDVEVKPSPIWLQSCLTKAGVKPINNIVDLTNYYAQLTGQPMHVYDYDKV
ncbi:MAG: phenylalanine--tRNA ligase beta subunit-related protein, partial [Candidatus Saccharimonadales bacterium]